MKFGSRIESVRNVDTFFQEGLSEEQLTDVIEKEKEDDMSSEQIDRAFEKVDTLSMEEVKAYDSELDDFLRK